MTMQQLLMTARVFQLFMVVQTYNHLITTHRQILMMEVVLILSTVVWIHLQQIMT